MKIVVHASAADSFAGEIVATALIRSFTAAQVTRAAKASAEERASRGIAVWIQPGEEAAGTLRKTLRAGGKAIVLGRIGPRVAAALGLQLLDPEELSPAWADCLPTADSHHDESPATIRYEAAHALGRCSPLAVRPLCRFDFANEWNNLGFGRIVLDGGPWSIGAAVSAGDAVPIARLAAGGQDRLLYAALRDMPRGSALWFNRAVGPVDSLEWRVVESFLSDYRAADLPCLPQLSEIPAGYAGAVCARLDCDEAVGTSRALVEFYRARGLPLSLALLTGQPLEDADFDLMREQVAASASVVSHSAHRLPNWGGDYETARTEAHASRAWFDEHLAEAAPMRYAVSPFHQNPAYAVQALADCGYQGFVGGIIANDPEFLLGRAGRVPFVSPPVVSLSAQCMLHGDCYHRYGNSADVYCQSFDQHFAAGSIFGYLDHPFSPRYQYGWHDEAERLAAHRQLVDHINRRDGIWWASLVQALDFLRQRDQTRIRVSGAGKLTSDRASALGRMPMRVSWKGQQLAID